MRRHKILEEFIIPVVEGLGYTFVGLQKLPQGRRALVRLFIDKPGGITIEDCERTSRQVEAVMNVKDPIPEGYILEVSSPGLDRLLFTKSQFEEQLGNEISVRLLVPKEGRRNFKGILESVDEEGIYMHVEKEAIMLPFMDISEARLVPKW